MIKQNNGMIKIKIFEDFSKDNDKYITTSFQKVTPGEEDDDEQEVENDWEDEEGESMIPDEWDDEDETTISKAVEYLENKKYTTQPSNEYFEQGISYSTTSPDTNYTTGVDTYYTCHLNGFTEKDEETIFMIITKNKEWYNTHKDLIEHHGIKGTIKRISIGYEYNL